MLINTTLNRGESYVEGQSLAASVFCYRRVRPPMNATSIRASRMCERWWRCVRRWCAGVGVREGGACVPSKTGTTFFRPPQAAAMSRRHVQFGRPPNGHGKMRERIQWFSSVFFMSPVNQRYRRSAAREVLKMAIASTG